jgi:tripartite-type tricarboxylate transporter receptor subunit TctC
MRPKPGADRRTRALSIAAALAMLPAVAHARYPERPIRMVVSSAPSSGPDVIARLVAARLTEAWHQQIVVDNRAGAGGNIGAEIVAKSPPDGYTMLVATANHAIAATLFPKLGYDLMKDFSPAGLIATTPYLLVVQPALPARTVQEFIALANARSGSLLYGSGGSGSPPHLVAEIFKSMAKIEMVHVPYKGVTPAITDLVGGQVQAVFAVVPAAMPLVKAGRLRALGVSTARASRLAPDVAPIAEAVPGFEVIGWYGLLLPAHTSPQIVARINEELQRSLQRADIEERLTAQGAEAAPGTVQGFGKFLSGEVAKWGRAVRASGAKVD